MNDQEKNELVDAIVKGEMPPANDYVEYLKEKTQNTLMELERVLMNKERLTRSLENVARRETELRAALTTYGASIVDWQTKEVANGGQGAGVEGNENIET